MVVQPSLVKEFKILRGLLKMFFVTQGYISIYAEDRQISQIFCKISAVKHSFFNPDKKPSQGALSGNSLSSAWTVTDHIFACALCNRAGNYFIPREIILLKALSGDISKYSILSSGKKNTKPVVGFGDVGTKMVTLEIPSASVSRLVTKPMM